jgi:hypothetical protein
MANNTHTNTNETAAVRSRKVGFGSLLKGDALGEPLFKHLPYILLLALLMVLYISNSYYVERRAVEIQKLNKRVKDLHSRYIAVKAELMYISQQNEVANRLSDEGIHETVIPPNVITVQPQTLDSIY